MAAGAPGGPVGPGKKWAAAPQGWISFSLWAVFAEHAKETPGSSVGSCRERMHPQSTDGLSAQVALLQSPILSAAGAPYRFDNTAAKQTTTMN